MTKLDPATVEACHRIAVQVRDEKRALMRESVRRGRDKAASFNGALAEVAHDIASRIKTHAALAAIKDTAPEGAQGDTDSVPEGAAPPPALVEAVRAAWNDIDCAECGLTNKCVSCLRVSKALAALDSTPASAPTAALVEAVRAYFAAPDAEPPHPHTVDAVWDDGVRGGTTCETCAAWFAMRKALAGAGGGG